MVVDTVNRYMTTSLNHFTHPWAAKGYAIADLFPKSDAVFYRLPLAQRDYAWRNKTIKALLDPILSLSEKWENSYKDLKLKGYANTQLDPQVLVENSTVDYYTIGTATFSTVSGSNEIVERFPRSNPVLLDILDGQQRLTTLTMVLLACWHLLEENGHKLPDPAKAEDLAAELKERLRVNDSSREPVSRVFRHRDGNSADIGFFVISVMSGDYAKYTEHDLYDPFDFIVGEIGAHCTLSEDETEYLDLLNLVDTVLYGVRCGALVAPPGKTTETFIVINRAGEPLTEMDIIKCYILDLCQQNSRVEKKVEKRFVKLLSEGTLEEVVRMWIDAKHKLEKPADKKHLSKNFSALNLGGNEAKAEEVMEELEEASLLYSDLRAGLVDGEDNHHLKMANSLKVHSTYSIVLAAPEEHRQLVADIVSRAVTIRKICGGPLMGSYHAAVYGLCGKVADGIFLSPDGEFLTEDFESAVQEAFLREFIRSEFLRSVTQLNYSQLDHKKVMRVIFSNLGTLINKGFSTPNANAAQYSLDHFHPQSPDKADPNAQHWQSEEANDLLHSIGNITPLPIELNNKLGNRPIQERFDDIAKNSGDGIAVAKFCCSGYSVPSRDFVTGVTAHFRGNSHLADAAIELLPGLLFSRETWTPDQASIRTHALAKIALMLLDPEGRLLAAERRAVVDSTDAQVFFMSHEKLGYDARLSAVWDEDELVDFILLKGSNLRLETVDSAPASLRNHRGNLVRDGLASEVGGCLVTKADIRFETLSGAAAIVAGVGTNGRKSWVDETGTPVADLEEARQN